MKYKAQQKYFRQKREQGFCMKCSRPLSERSKWLCDYHLEQKKEKILSKKEGWDLH